MPLLRTIVPPSSTKFPALSVAPESIVRFPEVEKVPSTVSVLFAVMVMLTCVGRVTRDRRRPINGEGAAFDIQGALREAAVDLGHASGGLDKASGPEYRSGRSIFEVGAVIDCAVVDHGRAVRQRRAILIVDRCAIDQGGAIFVGQAVCPRQY